MECVASHAPGVALAADDFEVAMTEHTAPQEGFVVLLPVLRYSPRTSMTNRKEQGERPGGTPALECPACGQVINPGTPVGGSGQHVLHLGCYLARRDLTIIAALILERPVCLTCLSEKTGCTARAVEGYAEQMASTVVMSINAASCSICGNVTSVYSIKRP